MARLSKHPQFSFQLSFGYYYVVGIDFKKPRTTAGLLKH